MLTLTQWQFRVVPKRVSIKSTLLLILVFTRGWLSLLSQPISSFYATPQVGCNPLKVDFVNTSLNATSYLWDFGNGNTSTLKNPGAVYNLSGNYTITLIAYNSVGQSDTQRFSNYITVFKSPVAKFLSKDKQICEGDSMYFTDVTELGDANIVKWQWDFGDGGTSSEQHPDYLYTLNGKFDVTFAVKDSNGCESSFKGSSYAEIIKPPIIDFKADLTNKCKAPLDVQLNSTITGAWPFTYNWSLGDGQNSTAENPKHTYKNQGVFSVKLVVTDAIGCVDSIEKNSLIKIQDPIAGFTPDRKEICAGEYVYFKNNSTPNDGTGLLSWDFGNGDTSNIVSPNVRYKTPGTYSVRLKYTWDGCSDTALLVNGIKVNEIPNGKIAPRDTVVCRKENASLPYFLYGNGIENGLWKVNTSPSEKLNSNTTFQLPLTTNGKFKIIAQPVSRFGCVGKADTVTVIVRGPQPSIITDSNKGCIPFNVKAKYSGTSEAPIIQYSWSGLGKSGNGANIEFVKNTFGFSPILLTVIDSNGCSATASKLIDGGLVIQPDFKIPVKICRNEPFWIQNKSSIKHEDTVIFRYSWDGKDTLDFLPVDSIRAKSNDTPNHYREYTFIAISHGCTTLVVNKPIKIMGPMLEASMNNWCDKDSFSGLNKSKDFTRSFWKYKSTAGSEILDFNRALNRKISQTNDLWLYAYNDTNKCSDSLPFTMKIDPTVPRIISDFNCASGVFKATHNYYGLKDSAYVWTITHISSGAIQIVKDDELKLKLTIGGEYTIELKVNNPIYSCTPLASTRLFVTPRPQSKPIVTVDRTSCYPVNINLEYPDFDQWKSAQWRINNVLIPDTANLIQYQYTGNTKQLAIIHDRIDNAGCKVSDTFKFEIGGFVANISHNQVVVPCKPVVVNFNTSVNGQGTGAFQYKWDFGYKQSNKQHDTVLVKGKRWVKAILSVNDQAGCASQAQVEMEIDNGDPQAYFYVNDTTVACPPLNVEFTDSSKAGKYPIVKRLWDFGDGSQSDKVNPGKLYIYPGNYTVRLVVINSQGCRDTHSIPDLVIVKGPQGTYNFDKNKGCTPLEVNLETKIKGQISKLEFDMGDGAVLNTSAFKHKYSRPGIYIPRLIVIDSNGCKFSPLPSDTITVYPTPIADFVTPLLCDNQTYRISHNTSIINDSITQVKWTLNEDSVSNENAVVLNFKGRDKRNRLTLEVSSSHACRDSVTKPLRIFGIEPSGYAEDSTLCLGQKAKVFLTSTGDTTLTEQHLWLDGNKIENRNPLEIVVNKRGRIPATLMVKDAIGCLDTLNYAVFLKVGDTLAPPPLRVYRSSVLSDTSTTTRFNMSREPDFKSYSLYVWKQNKWSVVANSEQVLDTNLIAHGLNTLKNSYCHKIIQSNFCDMKTDSTKVMPHCTVEIQAQVDTNASIVTWNPYSGWPVEKYLIYRKRAEEPYFVELATVAGSVTRYIDSSVYCHAVYDYKIEAQEKNGFKQISWSDTARSAPLHLQKVPSPEVWRTTVDSNLYTRTEWIMPKSKYPIVSYKLWRKVQEQWELVANNLEANNALVYLDYATQVQEKSYTYRVAATDACGGESEPGTIGKSILLKVGTVPENGAAMLTWTKYEEWNEGVESYRVERSIAGSDFEEIGRVDAAILFYIDSTLPHYCTKDFQYRVVGIRNQPLQRDSSHDVRSYSNFVQYLPELRFFIPNAYTPNENQLNETFHPNGMYWQSYEMRIYNRYGQKLYDNNSCLNAWDGTYMGELVQDGVYAYAIKVVDLKGQVYMFNGTVHLLR